ncbi:TonB-dependent receptor [Sediminibacterium soli]|uniref:TonB-dependent receptor n=1 Tax=Sediminibacterium soli TaxID=2698829 RepID=UPI00137A4C09|nr:TonB-dependent receptor [Sediminibacterium soli]NCI46816.1 TonB-dependent receptor [Sediminibacterium soli]
MKKQWILSLVLFPFFAHAQLNGALIISGKIVGESHEALPSVAVSVKNTTKGTLTDSAGRFSLIVSQKLPFRLVITAIGFAPQELEIKNSSSQLTVQLTAQTYIANEVVVTASRTAEKLLRSPVAIEKLDLRALKETPAASFYDALGNVKGVQLTTSSLTFKVPNTRGFNIPNNFRFMQLVDGIDMQAATLGVPLGNAIGPTELDIQSIEITPGAASALYGMNAINGMANLITKNPFTSQGLSVYQRTGVNHVNGKDHPPSLLTETAIRYARAFGNRFAFKLNLDYLRGTDWISDNRNDQNPNSRITANPSYSSLNGAGNIAFDGWNKYGDDALAGSNTVSVTGLTIDGQTNRTLTVARTGYWEKDLVDPKVDNLKFDMALQYRFSEGAAITYSYRAGKMDGVFQRGNKIRLDNVVVQNHQLELKTRNITVKAYVSQENTGNSYNVKPLADNLDLYTGGSASQWGAKYRDALNAYAGSHGGALTSANLVAATQYAREQADLGRAEPGTPRFAAVKDSIIRINNWDIRSSSIPNAPVTGGAALVQKSNLYHIEAQWNLTPYLKFANVLTGADVRVYELIPDGNNFVDFSRPIADRNTPLPDGSFGARTYYRKAGGFIQLTKNLLEDRLKLNASLRADGNTAFPVQFTPRAAVVYTIAKKHNIRFTFQKGYRFPALFEALSYVNNGRVKRVGILPVINEGLGYRENSYTQSSVAIFNAAVKAAGNTDAAALANRNLLQAANLPDGRPEGIVSFEIGYKTVLFDDRLLLDIDAYTNVYDGFLGQVQVFVPTGEQIGSDAAVIAMIDRNRDATAAANGNAASKGQERYRVYTNAVNHYTSYGSSLGITYRFQQGYALSGNANYNGIRGNHTPDLFVTGFNTPAWTSNLSFGNRAVTRNIGFNIVWKWQDGFLWESPLVNGRVEAISTVDAQLTFRLPAFRSTVKLGGANILDTRHIQYAGGPTIGAMYYTAITWEGLAGK